jgi:Cytochrome P460/Haem-binding domain
LAWFDRVVPAYWVVASDVKRARRPVNFSEIGAQPAAQQQATLYEAVNMIRFGAMPLPSYRRVHPGAAVTDGQLAALEAYLNPPARSAPVPEGDVPAAPVADASRQVSAAPNGIAFPSEYKNWKVVSTTDRFDNQTIRAVLGNDVAIKAVAENHMNPWPDGATFAKVAWRQTGAFFQVEFMIKDSRKYAATLGWGFARWRGVDLKPYGKDANFANECVGCHTPLRKSDFVYTLPIKAQPSPKQNGTAMFNQGAELTGELPANPLEWRVIGSALDQQDSTMSTLFGNDLAVQYARTSAQHNYPAGSMLSLITWTEQDDPRWFGARIPATPKSVEFVTVRLDAEHRPLYSYQDFEGSPLKKTQAQESSTPNERTAYLLAQPAAVMP